MTNAISLSTIDYQPRAEHKFSFGLWTVGNRGRDAFGDFVRPPISPDDIVSMLAEVGAWGVNLHDNDLVPIDATPAERDSHRALLQEGLRDKRNRGSDGDGFICFSIRYFVTELSRPTILKCARTLFRKPCEPWILEQNWERKFSSCGAAAKASRPTPAAAPMTPSSACAKPSIISANTIIDRGYGMKFALEAKPNEPRADIYMATTGQYLGFIPTLDHPEMVGVNPEVAHEQMSGLNFMHAVAQAWEAGKLFHIDLNDQMPGRFDQDLRFGSSNLKSAFWLVKFLEDVGYAGSAPLRCPCVSHRGSTKE